MRLFSCFADSDALLREGSSSRDRQVSHLFGGLRAFMLLIEREYAPLSELPGVQKMKRIIEFSTPFSCDWLNSG